MDEQPDRATQSASIRQAAIDGMKRHSQQQPDRVAPASDGATLSAEVEARCRGNVADGDGLWPEDAAALLAALDLARADREAAIASFEALEHGYDRLRGELAQAKHERDEARELARRASDVLGKARMAVAEMHNICRNHRIYPKGHPDYCRTCLSEPCEMAEEAADWLDVIERADALLPSASAMAQEE